MEKEGNNVYVGFKNNGNDFNYVLSKAFKDMRKQFFIANGIEDSDILSIKKDAIFVIKKRCRNTWHSPQV